MFLKSNYLISSVLSRWRIFKQTKKKLSSKRYNFFFAKNTCYIRIDTWNNLDSEQPTPQPSPKILTKKLEQHSYINQTHNSNVSSKTSEAPNFTNIENYNYLVDDSINNSHCTNPGAEAGGQINERQAAAVTHTGLQLVAWVSCKLTLLGGS